MTNGRYKSVEHQVVVNQSQPRLSIATFCSPLLDTVITPLPQLLHQISHADFVLYPKYTFRDYVRLYMQHELGGKRFLECVKDFGNLPTES
jgi:isopenicillin N synthase-like dioxygenase